MCANVSSVAQTCIYASLYVYMYVPQALNYFYVGRDVERGYLFFTLDESAVR